MSILTYERWFGWPWGSAAVKARVLGFLLGCTAWHPALAEPSLPDVTTFHQSKAGLQSVTVTGIATPRGSQTSVWFEYGADGAYGYATTPQILPDTGNGANRFTATISVPGGGTVHYRAVAENSVGKAFGTDAVASTGNAANVALGKPVVAVSSESGGSNHRFAQNLTDGSTRDLLVQDIFGNAARNVDANWWVTAGNAGVGG